MPFFKLFVEGNLGRDAELKEVNGQVVISFSIAINQDYKDAAGNKVNKTTWINCQKWQEKGRSTGIVQYLKKGSKVIVEGAPEINLWKDSQNNSRADFRCRVKEIHLVSSTANNNSNGDTTAEQSNVQPVGSVSSEQPEDDLPF